MVLEIPAGKLDAPDEDPTEAALRELREETGASCEKLTYLGPLYTTPALIDEVIHMYMAEGLTFGETDLDEDEFIEVERIPLDELVDRICHGEVPDSKTQACVLRAKFEKLRRAGEV
jgi:ADP-ribose pyrophosphatase